MSREQAFSQIRAAIAAGDAQEALTLLATYLRSAPATERTWQDTVITLQSRLERTRQDERLGVITYTDAQLVYNQVTQDILEVLESIENGQQPPPDANEEQRARAPLGRRYLPWVALGGLMAGLVAIGLFIFYQSRNQQIVERPVEPLPAQTCPDFGGQAVLRILVLPFRPLAGAPTNTHIAIRNRLSRESEVYRINASVRTVDIDLDDINTYPANGREAEALARPCSAQLVIWGTTEEQPGEDIIITNYRFIDQDGGIPLSRLQMTESAEVDTISSISSIAIDGVLTESIETGIKLLFGLIAHETQQDSLAVAILEATDVRYDTAARIQSLILADSYLKQQQTDKAIAAYSRAIEIAPNDELARNNRGLLLYRSGAYEAAAQDLSVALEQNPQDTVTRAVRASAFIKAGRLDKASEDIPDRQPGADRQIKGLPRQALPYNWETIRREYEAKAVELQRQKASIDRQVSRNPTDVEALEQQAELARNQGKYDEAWLTTQRIIRFDPDNVRAFSLQTEIQLERRDTAAARRVLRQAMQQDISPTELVRKAPQLQSLLPAIGRN